ncbi:MAG TPA: ATP-binding protein [Longimicrobiales bacterium]|nr:ATP-binding protein [Longimicrobiales bacterium]
MSKAVGMNVLVLAPWGADGAVAKQVLEKAGIATLICRDMSELCSCIDEAGVLLIAEEALDDPSRDLLFAALDAQPSWSDLPVIVLTTQGELSRSLPREVTELTARANLTLLERPVRVATLMTMISSGLRARKRQLDLRDVLEDVREARNEADGANRAKSQFLTTMSHELRTPLNAIAGYTEILTLEIAGPINAQQREHLARIAKSEQHLLALIDDVLDFAKIEAGHLSFQIEDFDATQLVADLDTFIEPQLVTKGIEYKANVASGLNVHGDAEKTRQILLNLLSNAIKFTPEEGQIELTAERRGDTVKFTVRDNGNGVERDKLDAIFEPFVQVGRAFNAPGQGGTGLGLSISRDLARKMNGELVATSKMGEGSLFTLTLPAAVTAGALAK